MDWVIILILVIGAYSVVELVLKHRERMEELKSDNSNEDEDE
jgi:hypothetical protein